MDQSPTLERFEMNDKFARLGVRRHTFYKMVAHLERQEKGLIIETGTAWDKDNWEGQGQSTLIWDWACTELPKFNTISIDMNPEAAKMAGEFTKHVTYITNDSVIELNQTEPHVLGICRLLYLDSFDWTPEGNLDSAFHHMAELAAVWRHLPSGCMVVVDDRHGNMKGKHFMVEAFMDKLGIEPVFRDYQIGWVKP